ncbi:LAFE_0C10462g1_1 [Lachancea fermentati]|uniref:RNA helicase n=1 Tax=Lachancea fermentati TaxID=4955 RepID=A0A1G4MA64_LACFM|nr:LAFE_0C10462g1_1 [Lachancea fermentati]
MGTYRKRFNEKARAGHMAKLKELKKVRNKQFLRHLEDGTEDNNEHEAKEIKEKDPNAEILEPLSKEEKDLKKRKLKELFMPNDSKVSRAKKKRLEKFVEHQLKREEKKVLIEKLQDYKIDTSILTSSKKLGQGRQTRKEEFEEALQLEKQGRSDDHVREILYEERELKDWPESGSSGGENEEDHDNLEDSTEAKQSSFIDNRPSKFGGSGFGFGFANAKVVNKSAKASKRKYNWKQRIEMEEQRKHSKEEDLDFESSSGEESEGSEKQGTEEDSLNENSHSATSDQNSSVNEDYEDISNEEPEDSMRDDDHKSQAQEFKEWATQEIKKLDGSNLPMETPTLDYEYKPITRPEDLEDGLSDNDAPVDEKSERKAFYVPVNRPEEIQKVRMQLPVFGEEHRIMEAIHHNDVLIVCGETGSGKTTQVPQFLFESGYGHPQSPENPGMIGITQPRRVAAVSMAKRVSQELGNYGDRVAYQIRFDSTTKDDTRMKFMTDGVLLREMTNDFKLSKYSAIIIDEAHERNINTDILIGMLSRCVSLRAKAHLENPALNKRLKLIIMSATLRVSDFSNNQSLFPSPPPVLKVDARQYPVSVHFNKRTAFDYAEEAFRKTCKIHQRLPRGAILVFLTGQQEINHMVKRLRREFPFPNGSVTQKEMDSSIPTMKVSSKHADVEAEEVDFSAKVQDIDDTSDISESSEDDNEEGFEETLEDGQTKNDPLYVLPLYSLLPTKEQLKVFQNPPAGSRLCVVATNVAETSLTIPNVRYVVDCGRAKERKYNENNGVQSFEVDWISKASAGQRSGRAGRTGPGHCYRLYSSAVYENDFAQFSRPEILRMPVESVVLQMKGMGIYNIINFPFPTPPDVLSLSKAIKLLQYLGALDDAERITDDGKTMSFFPLSPRFSKMLLVGNEHGCLPYIITIVSALSVGDPFITEHELGLASFQEDNEDEPANSDDDERKKKLRSQYFKSLAKFSRLDRYSDVMKLLSAVSALDYVKPENRPSFMESNFLRPKLVEEIRKLRQQLLYIVKSNTSVENIAVTVNEGDLKCGVPSEAQVKLLKQMVCAGFIDQVAIRADYLHPDTAKLSNRMAIMNIPYVPVLSQKTNDIEDCYVYIHPNSILSTAGEEPPKYLVFQALQLNKNKETSKTRMKTLCDIKSTPLANIARKGSLITYSKPLSGKGVKPIDISSTERYCYVIPRFGASVDSDLKVGWDLNPIAVHQKKDHGKWAVIKFITSKNYRTLDAGKN